uniref:Uncharacterized protein n=1 Tax=Peronospora matthiolae TaxID=2874970 RepID=A0AAV1TL48_9STRA
MATHRRTDFTAANDPASLRAFNSVGAALGATFALSFTEACLTIERRPIPLRFAVTFAALNVFPSAVWSTVSARHVAAASNVARSSLVQTTELTGSRSSTVGKRLVLVKSVRALRMITGSYGVVWSFLSSNWIGQRLYPNREVCTYTERVLRLAPIDSALSRISRRRYADHIVAVPIGEKGSGIEHENENVAWDKVGLDVILQKEIRKTVKVMEVEIPDKTPLESTIASVRTLQAQVSKNGQSSLSSVAVLPHSDQVMIPSSVVATFDVWFNPMSAVLTFIAAVCHNRDEKHVVIVADWAESGTDVDKEVAEVDGNGSKFISRSLLTGGLLYRHGITSRVCSHVEVESVELMDSKVVVLIGTSLRAARTLMRKVIEQGGLAQDQYLPCFVVEESLAGQSGLSEECQAHSALLEKTVSLKSLEELEGAMDDQQEQPTYFSIADVSDQTLQGIRQLLRQGEEPDAIQAALYRAYGTQRVVAPHRLDQFSNMDV